jgi:hypothetical protein
MMLTHDNDPTLALREDLQAIRNRYLAAEVPPETFPINGFLFDNTEYAAEIAVLNALYNEYRFSFCFGLYGDQTEAKLDEFIMLCKAAGVDKIIEEYRQQLAAFNAQ